jgi:hypothetical protein
MNTTAESSLLCRLGTELAEGIMQFVLMYKIIACAMGVLLTIIAVVIEVSRLLYYMQPSNNYKEVMWKLSKIKIPTKWDELMPSE